MFGRIDIQANNGLQFLGEMRIVVNPEAFYSMRLEPMCTPDATHAGF